jgi:hypothetical protein
VILRAVDEVLTVPGKSSEVAQHVAQVSELERRFSDASADTLQAKVHSVEGQFEQ